MSRHLRRLLLYDAWANGKDGKDGKDGTEWKESHRERPEAAWRSRGIASGLRPSQ
jgi:hypothetical protein